MFDLLHQIKRCPKNPMKNLRQNRLQRRKAVQDPKELFQRVRWQCLAVSTSLVERTPLLTEGKDGYSFYKSRSALSGLISLFCEKCCHQKILRLVLMWELSDNSERNLRVRKKKWLRMTQMLKNNNIPTGWAAIYQW